MLIFPAEFSYWRWSLSELLRRYSRCMCICVFVRFSIHRYEELKKEVP